MYFILGEVGAWKKVLTPEESERMDALLKEVGEAGLTFDASVTKH